MGPVVPLSPSRYLEITRRASIYEAAANTQRLLASAPVHLVLAGLDLDALKPVKKIKSCLQYCEEQLRLLASAAAVLTGQVLIYDSTLCMAAVPRRQSRIGAALAPFARSTCDDLCALGNWVPVLFRFGNQVRCAVV